MFNLDTSIRRQQNEWSSVSDPLWIRHTKMPNCIQPSHGCCRRGLQLSPHAEVIYNCMWRRYSLDGLWVILEEEEKGSVKARHVLKTHPHKQTRNHQARHVLNRSQGHKCLGKPLLGLSACLCPSMCINRIVYPRFLIQQLLTTVFPFPILMHFFFLAFSFKTKRNKEFLNNWHLTVLCNKVVMYFLSKFSLHRCKQG